MNSNTLATRQRFHFVLLVLILAFAGALRFYSLSTLGLWTDELGAMSASDGWGLQFAMPPVNRVIDPPLPIFTRLTDARPITQIIHGLIKDESHPPVYFILLRFWRSMLGDGESSVRMLNVVFSLISIPLLFYAATRTVGVVPALWACLLMAVASPQITFSQEARNYMPGMTFSLVALVCLLRLESKPSFSRAVAFSIALLVMMLTHYFTAGAGVAMAIHVVTSLRGRTRRFSCGAILTAALVFLLIWGIPLYRQLPNFHSNYAWLSDDSPGHVQRWLLRLCRVPMGLIADSSWSMAAASGFAFLWLPIAFIRQSRLRVWILWLVCCVGLIAGLDLARSTTLLTLPRYLLFATPAAYVLIAAAIRGRWSWVLPSCAVVAAILALPSAYIPPWKTDFRTPVQIMAPRIQPGDALVIIGTDPAADGVMLTAFQHYLPTMPATCAILTRPPDAATLSRLRQCPSMILVRLWPYHPEILPGIFVDPRNEISVPYFADFAIGQFSPNGSK